MKQFEKLESLLNEQGGMLQTSEAVKQGISKPVFYNYVKEKNWSRQCMESMYRLMLGLMPCI